MIRLFEMFAGYGGASFALKKAEIEHEVVGYSEIDKCAIKCYEQNHKGKNFGDCTKINPNELPDFDLLTGGFPCQAFSNAGKQLGVNDSRGTLFWEIVRIAKIKKPKYMLLENVKGLLSKKFVQTFDKILKELDEAGYIVVKYFNDKMKIVYAESNYIHSASGDFENDKFDFSNQKIISETGNISFEKITTRVIEINVEPKSLSEFGEMYEWEVVKNKYL